jgi:hypothetical protein
MQNQAAQMEVQRARDEIKNAEKAMATHKRYAQGGGAEWRGTWDNGHWHGDNSFDLNKIYTNLYIKVGKAYEKLEQALNKVDPYRHDRDVEIERLKERRKQAGKEAGAHFDSLLDRLVMVILRNKDYNANAGKYLESLVSCTHYFQGRTVACDCVADELGFLSLSVDNKERLKNKRVCFIGEYHSTSGPNYGHPVCGPIKPYKGYLHIAREWFKEGKNLNQRCEHYHQRPSGWIDEPRDMVPCDCIKQGGSLNVNPDNIWIKNHYYGLESHDPITISRQYKVIGVSHQGADILGFECNHYTRISGCEPDDFSLRCDCMATGELSNKMKKFDARGLVEKNYYGEKLNATSNITISRETRGLIPHPQGHSCRHVRDDGGTMECDCIPLFNKHTVENFEDVVYELSEDMQKRQAAGRVDLAYKGKLQVGGFFKQVFFPSLGGESYTQKATPYDV